jgi:hypothetical protein
MSCRIEYQAGEEGVLQAAVSGRSTLADAAWIARNIAREAGKSMLKRVLIDVRNLADRVGTLATLAMADGNSGRVKGYRVAMVDNGEYDRYYVFAELEARQRGCRLRRFSDRAAAAAWLKYGYD